MLVEIQGAKGIPATEMLWFNSISSLPVLIALTWAFGESAVMGRVYSEAVAKHGVSATLTAIGLCSTGGIILNFSIFLATGEHLMCAHAATCNHSSLS